MPSHPYRARYLLGSQAKFLDDHGACQVAINWLNRRKFRTLAAAWRACPRRAWMEWLIEGVPEAALRRFVRAHARTNHALRRWRRECFTPPCRCTPPTYLFFPTTLKAFRRLPCPL